MKDVVDFLNVLRWDNIDIYDGTPELSYALGVFVGKTRSNSMHFASSTTPIYLPQPTVEQMIEKADQILSNNTIDWRFLQGVFDVCGTIEQSTPLASLKCEEAVMNMLSHIDIPHSYTDNDAICFSDTNCIDFLGYLYKDTTFKPTNQYQKYVDLLYRPWKPKFSLPVCTVFKAHDDAILPSKAKESDAGYDLTIIKEVKKLTGNVTLYDTCIKVAVPHGMYSEVIPRSSLSKSGYMLANSIGIIDRSYTGNILIALAKIDPNSPDIQLPFRCCQLIFRNQIHVEMTATTEDLSVTARGDGGFGSTNK